MTIKRLEEYADIRREIRDLERRIERCRNSRTFDAVEGAAEFPYAKHTIVVRGIGRIETARATRLRRQLEVQRDALSTEAVAVEEFLSGVNDSKLRQIIRYKYIDGLSWAATANRVYGHPCEDRARKRVTRFFEKN